MDELERARDEALASHARKGFDMFAEDGGAAKAKRPKILSQKVRGPYTLAPSTP
jgi:hypothetical protein